MKGMKRVRRGRGDQYLHRTNEKYRTNVRRKLRAYHIYIQLGCIAQGLLQHLAINHTAEVWKCFRSWLLTMDRSMPPSELIVATALRSTLAVFLAIPDLPLNLTKIVRKYANHEPPSEDQMMAA
jgi:hypothetical protein